MDPHAPPTHKHHFLAEHRSWLWIALVILIGVASALLFMRFAQNITPPVQQVTVPARSTEKPTLKAEAIVTGYDHIWDIAFLPTKEMLFTERGGTLRVERSGNVTTVAKIPEVAAKGEGGLLGLAVDPTFAENRSIYLCFNSQKGDVRVVRYKLAEELNAISDGKDIITGMPAIASGRHSGCRIAFGPDGFLYVGTGDAAQGGAAIDHKNLGGKILRVDRDGKAAPGNMGGDFDPRIFSYGHRNVQGIAFFPTAQQGAIGVSVEHGSTIDDEVNLLTQGNFGWAHPAGLYTEINVPMTDKAKYPDAIDAMWSSGFPTIAPSGATFLSGTQWKAWDGALAMAVLKGKHLKIFTINEQNKVTATEDILPEFGRLRTAVQGLDGNLYLATDNGANDQIIRVTPQ